MSRAALGVRCCRGCQPPRRLCFSGRKVGDEPRVRFPKGPLGGQHHSGSRIKSIIEKRLGESPGRDAHGG